MSYSFLVDMSGDKEREEVFSSYTKKKKMTKIKGDGITPITSTFYKKSKVGKKIEIEGLSPTVHSL